MVLWCQVWALKRSKWDDLAADLKSILQDLMLFQLADDRRRARSRNTRRIQMDSEIEIFGFSTDQGEFSRISGSSVAEHFFSRSHTRTKCQRAVSSDEGKRNPKEREIYWFPCATSDWSPKSRITWEWFEVLMKSQGTSRIALTVPARQHALLIE